MISRHAGEVLLYTELGDYAGAVSNLTLNSCVFLNRILVRGPVWRRGRVLSSQSRGAKLSPAGEELPSNEEHFYWLYGF
jgi:hypothetical protein